MLKESKVRENEHMNDDYMEKSRLGELKQVSEAPKRRTEPLPRIEFCRHSLVPSYCAHCKFGEKLSEVVANS